MTLKFTSFLLLILIFNGLSVHAQTDNSQTNSTSILTAQNQFAISFFGTSVKKSIKVKVTYNSEKKNKEYEIKILELNDTTLDSFTMDKYLNYYVFEFEFNRIYHKIYSSENTISSTSVMDIYRMAWNINHDNSSGNEAGILQFNQYIMLLNRKTSTCFEDSAISRKTTIDDLVSNKLRKVQNNILSQETKMYSLGLESYKVLRVSDSIFQQAVNDLLRLPDISKYRTEYVRSSNKQNEIIAITKKHAVAKNKFEKAEFNLRELLSKESTYNFKRASNEKDTNDLKNAIENIKNLITKKELKSIHPTYGKTIIKYGDSNMYKKSNREYEELIEAYDKAIKYFNDSLNTEKEKSAQTVASFKSSLDAKNFDKIFKDSINLKDYMQNSSSFAELKALEKELKDQKKSEQDILDAISRKKIFKITNIEIQFEGGFIEKIKVWVDYLNSNYIFENRYAIGFTSTQNFKNLSSQRLFIRNSNSVDAEFIILADVFRNYDNRLEILRRNYSPSDTCIHIDPNKTLEIKLSKDKYTNIVQAKIFTDFKGVNRNNPNGLIQIEASRRFYLNTIRYESKANSDWGYFNHLDVWGAINKIEQNNRELTLRNQNVIQSGIQVSPNYATTLDFTRYENYSLGFALNLGLFDKPDQKFALFLDFCLKYGHVLINDTVLAPSGRLRAINSFPEAHAVTMCPKITLQLFDESRINLKLNYSLNNLKLFSNNGFKQVGSYQKSDLTSLAYIGKDRWFNSYEAFVSIIPNAERNNHVFVRFRFFSQLGDRNTSFSQFQVGYKYNWSVAR